MAPWAAQIHKHAWTVPTVLSLLMGMPLLFEIGFAIQKYLMGRAFSTAMEAPLIIAIGISLVLQNIEQVIWSPLSVGLTPSYTLISFGAGGVGVPLVYVLDIIAARHQDSNFLSSPSAWS